MITETPSIYKSGLTESEIQQMMSDYIDFSDKFNLKTNLEYSYFVVKYNKLTRLCYVRIQVTRINQDFTTGLNEIATPKNDCPIKEIGNIFAIRVTQNPSGAVVDTILSMKNDSMYCYVAPSVVNPQGFRFDANGISICELNNQ